MKWPEFFLPFIILIREHPTSLLTHFTGCDSILEQYENQTAR